MSMIEVFSCALLSWASLTTLHRVLTCARLSPGVLIHHCRRFFSCTLLSKYVWYNITQENYLCNVEPWQIKENNLYNAVSTILGQHCIRILSCQFCSNTSETTLHKKTTCIVLAQSGKTCFHMKTGCNFKCLVACFSTRYNITN